MAVFPLDLSGRRKVQDPALIQIAYEIKKSVLVLETGVADEALRS